MLPLVALVQTYSTASRTYSLVRHLMVKATTGASASKLKPEINDWDSDGLINDFQGNHVR